MTFFLLYLLVSVVTFAVIYAIYDGEIDSDNFVPAFLGSIFWPLSIIVFGAFLLGEFFIKIKRKFK